MSNNKYILILSLLLFFGISSCKDDYYEFEDLTPSLSPYFLWLSQTDFEHSSCSEFSFDFYLESYESAWKFSDVANWIKLTPSSGASSTSVILNGEENKFAEARTAIFYLESNESGWNYSRPMSVSQGKAIASLSIDKYLIYLGGAAGTEQVNVTSNCKWTSKCSDSWVSMSSDLTNGILSISVEANPLNSYRTSTVYVNYGEGKVEYIRLEQSPAEVFLSEYTLRYENVASKYSITIDSEMDWTSRVSDSWIQVTPPSGKTGKTEVSIEVAPNTSTRSRTGSVTIMTGTTQKRQITIVQKGIYIEADEKIEFTSMEESKTLKISSNTEWAVQTAPDWLTLSKAEGSGSLEISVKSAENPNTTSRTGEITIGQQGLDLKCTVKVTQLGKKLSLESTLLDFSEKAEQKSFNLFSDAKWTSSLSASWFSATPLSGKGDAVINVSVEENKTTDERTGVITYSYAGKTADVNVYQLAKYMTIDNNAFDFDSKGGSHIIELSTNDNWTAEIEHQVPWIKLSKMSGSGSATITLTVADNPSVNARSTAIVINTDYSQSIRILVSQQPRYFSVNTQSIQFFANGGTSDIVTISTDGAYEIKSDVSWFTINKVADTFTVCATKNTANETRNGKITIYLTDLKEGSLSAELSVVQAGNGGSFIIDGYTEDKDWDYIGDGSLIITINGYTSDKNWNESFGGKLTIKITGYTTDENWNN